MVRKRLEFAVTVLPQSQRPRGRISALWKGMAFTASRINGSSPPSEPRPRSKCSNYDLRPFLRASSRGSHRPPTASEPGLHKATGDENWQSGGTEAGAVFSICRQSEDRKVPGRGFLSPLMGYPAHATIRKLAGRITRKSSVTESQNSPHFLGDFVA